MPSDKECSETNKPTKTNSEHAQLSQEFIGTVRKPNAALGQAAVPCCWVPWACGIRFAQSSRGLRRRGVPAELLQGPGDLMNVP